MKIAQVVAMSRNRVIGRDNALPWHAPEDLKRFKRITTGRPVIMGRKTYASIGRPLPKRLNIVITRDRSFHADGVVNAFTVEEALRLAEESMLGDEAMVIGGAQIFELTLPMTQVIHLTEIELDVEGDTFFPPLDPAAWREAARERNAGPPPMSFVTLERVR
jgi:dihydrofolate reductase